MSPTSRRLSTTLVAALALVASACVPGAGVTAGGTAPAAPPPVGDRETGTPRPAPGPREVGIALSHFSTWASDEEIARDLDAVVASGATWLAAGLDWPSIERRPGVYYWDQDGRGGFDRTIRLARERGLEVFAMVAYTPTWARPADCSYSDKCPPADPDAFARFMRKAVERYAPQGVHAWQLWNEPNNATFWKPRPDPAAYTALIRAAYPVMKAADPSAVILAGGFSPGGTDPSGSTVSPVEFLTGMYRAGARGYFDALGHHPYSFDHGAFPFNGHPMNGFVQTALLHDVMAARGDGGKRIWATEAGAPTGTAPGFSVTEAQQVRYLNEYLDGWGGWVNFRYPDHRQASVDFAPFTGPLLWYQLRDQGTDPADREQNFGLLRHDGSAKPAYTALCMRARGSACRTPGDGSLVGAAAGQRSVQAAGVGRGAAANPVTGGYYVLEPGGAVGAYGGAPWFGSARFGFDIARDIAVMPDGRGYVVLDGWGGVHPFGSATLLPRTGTGYWRGWDIARSVAIAPDGKGFAVLDGWGGLHTAGSAAGITGLPYWRGWDIARAVVLPAGGGAYVLDGWGGIHASRGNGRLAGSPGPYWPGRDVARDLDVTVTGRGFAVLDHLGAVHTRGDAPSVARPVLTPKSRSWSGLALSGGAYVTVRAR